MFFILLALLVIFMATSTSMVLGQGSFSTQQIMSADGDSKFPTTDSTGALVAYQTQATNLLNSGDALNGNWQIVLHNRDVDEDLTFDEQDETSTTLISVSNSGQQANADATDPHMNGYGGAVVFVSAATNLTGEAGNAGKTLIYLKSIYGIDLVSRVDGGHPAVDVRGPSVSNNWTTAYYVTSQPNTPAQVWLHDYWNNTEIFVAKNNNGEIANDSSWDPSISGDSCMVAYTSTATNLDFTTTDTGADQDIFVYDRDPNHDGICTDSLGNFKTVRISIKNNDQEINANSYSPNISDNGRFIVFVSDGALDEVNDTNDKPDVYVVDRDWNENGVYDELNDRLLKVLSTSNYNSIIGFSYNPAVYYPYVVFDTSSVLHGWDTNSFPDVYIRNITLSSVDGFNYVSYPAVIDAAGNEASNYPAISASTVVFQSKATNLVSEDSTDAFSDIFLFDFASGIKRKLSIGQQNTTTVIDNGFQLGKDDYSFQNKGLSESDVYLEDFKTVFGNWLCFNPLSTNCDFLKSTYLYYIQVKKAAKNGVCYGFAVSSLRFFEGLDDIKNFDGAEPYQTSHIPSSPQAQRNLVFYFMQQMKKSVRNYEIASKTSPLSSKLDQIKAALASSNPNEAVVISFSGKKINSGKISWPAHAVTPYKAEQVSLNVWRIYIYDNNFTYGAPSPSDWYITNVPKFIEINLSNNTWVYNHGYSVSYSLEFSSSVGFLAVAPMSLFTQNPAVSNQSGGGTLPTESDSTYKEIFVDGNSATTVTNELGQSISRSTNQIPDAYYTTINSFNPDNLSSPIEIYNVPVSGAYTIEVDGIGLVQTEIVSVTEFGPGFGVFVEGINLTPNATHELKVFENNGLTMQYNPTSSQSVTLGMAYEASGESYYVALKGVEVYGGVPTKLIGDNHLNGDTFLNTSFTTSGSYDVVVERIDSEGSHSFIHSGIAVYPGDRHILEYDAWNGQDEMILVIEHPAGSQDVLYLENQTAGSNRIYLPIVIR